jgi:hypothetical protein
VTREPFLVAQDSLRAIIDDVFSAGEYRWRESSGLRQWILDTFGSLLDWLDALRGTHPIAYMVFIAVNVGILIAILVHFAYVISRTLRYRTDADGGPDAAPEIRDANWHLRAARRHGEAGRFVDALVHRFTALVLDLDGRDALRFHPSKTPAEYAGEVKLTSEARERFRGLIDALYTKLFGGVPCTSDEWAAFDRTAGELPRHVAPR